MGTFNGCPCPPGRAAATARVSRCSESGRFEWLRAGDDDGSIVEPYKPWRGHGVLYDDAMDEQPTNALRAKVVTASDGVVAGTREDRSGDALCARLVDSGWEIVERRTIPDGIESVRDTLVELAKGFSGIIVTTGGTGFGPRDLTPEGTRAAIEREAPGLAEAMRLCNPDGLGRLSRAIAGTRGTALILNTPGSTRGCVETIEAVLDVLPHAVDLMAGGRPH
jgi:molybdopterin adenylyltransferase